MATYKVIQDIESEDKLLGPLTLRQFVYAAMVMVMGFIAFKLAAVSPLLILPFLLPMGFFGLLAAPFGHDQSSEVWLLAKIGFMLKPRRRLWDQTGMRELVTITVPKRVEKHLTDGLTQMEVKSRLQALANTIDSRGWAVKNVNVNLYDQPSYAVAGYDDSDRLVEGTMLPQQALAADDVSAADDMLDEANNPTAQHLNTMINQSSQSHHQQAVAVAQNGSLPAVAPPDYWFMNQPSNSQPLPPGSAVFDSSPTIIPGATSSGGASDVDDAAQELLEEIHRKKAEPKASVQHMRTLDPAGDAVAKSHSKEAAKKVQESVPPPPSQIATPPEPVTTNDKATIARLAANDDLNVATIAREADKAAAKQFPDDEVVISLR